MGLVAHITRFSRLLRAAGLQAGPDRVLTAIAAVEAVGLDRRDDVRAALATVMLDHHEQQALFDAAFDAFWRAPGHSAQAALPVAAAEDEAPHARRLAEALAALRADAPPPALPTRPGPPAEVPPEVCDGYSARERLRRADFETLSAAEYACASRTRCCLATRGRAGNCRPSSCCSTSRARWTAMRGSSCITCTA